MLEEQYREIRERVDAACLRAGRKPEEVTLIAVSKTKPAEMIQQVYHAGARDFGENRVQELLEKEPLLPGDIRWHMIGHLQTNKVRQVVGKACLIHSVDTLHLAEEIQKESAKRGICTDILLEVNAAREESKYGFFLEEAEEAAVRIGQMPNVRIRGLMTIAPLVRCGEENREVFRNLYKLYVDMKTKNIDNGTMTELSMGMTGDFETAVEEGATMVRVGTGIFGARQKREIGK